MGLSVEERPLHSEDALRRRLLEEDGEERLPIVMEEESNIIGHDTLLSTVMGRPGLFH